MSDLPILPHNPPSVSVLRGIGWLSVAVAFIIVLFSTFTFSSFLDAIQGALTLAISAVFLFAFASTLEYLNQIRWAVMTDEQKRAVFAKENP